MKTMTKASLAFTFPWRNRQGQTRLIDCLRAVVLLCALAAGAAHAATYANRSIPQNWVNPSSHARVAWTNGAACSSGYVGAAIDDDISAQLPLGFTFNYGGVNYSQVQVMSNGRLQFGNGFCGYGTQTVGPPPTYPYPYPNASVVRTLRVYGADLDPTPTGAGGVCPTANCYVSYATEGTAPNRRFVVTWVNVPEWGRTARTGSFNLQVILEESSNEFVYQFGASSHPTGGSAQIGWQLTTADYDVWSTPVVPPANSSVRFFIPAPVAELRLDEAAWSGTGSVVNSTAGGSNGSPVGAAQTVIVGKLCNGGNIPSNSSTGAIDAIDTGYDVDSQIGSNGTITFWYKSNAAWSGGGSKSAQLLDATVSNNRWFYLTKQNGNGRLSFNLTDNANNNFQAATGNNTFAANNWVHVAVTWKLTPVAANNRLQIFINGALVRTVAMGTTQPLSTAIGTLFVGDNRSAFVTNPGTGNSADGVVDEIRIYNSEVTNAVILRDFTAARSCAPIVVTPSGFNGFDSSTAAGRVTGVIKTKIAASAFGLDVVALNTAGTAVETAFTGDVRLELVDASSAASCGTSSTIRALGTVIFRAVDQGRKTLAGISEPNAWPNARIRMKYPATGTPTVIACSTDNFSIRPASLSVAVSDTNWQTAGATRTLANMNASGGLVHKAGQPFTLRATARDASGNITGNYAGLPTMKTLACTLPTPTCTDGILTPGVWSGSGSGTVASTSASYSEAGSFNLTLEDQTFANVDNADSTLLERTIPQAAVLGVGRFVPDHFELTPGIAPRFRTFNETPANCPVRSFTYIGQPFRYAVMPTATLLAKGQANNTLANYKGSLWKIGGATAPVVVKDCMTDPNTCVFTSNWSAGGASSDVIETYTYALTPASTPGWNNFGSIPTAANVNPGTGLISFAASDTLAFQRSNVAPQAPFTASIANSITVRDLSEAGNCGVANCDIATTTPAQFGNIGFDVPNGNRFRFGRLALSNAHGSELLALPVPIETQFWDGTNFRRNAEDSCTLLAQNNVALANWQRDLDLCETSVMPALAARFNGGRGNLRLTAPGAGNTGSVNLTVNLGAANGNSCVGGPPALPALATGALQTWLQGRGAGGLWNLDPVVRASFGLFRGSRSLIYIREIY